MLNLSEKKSAWCLITESEKFFTTDTKNHTSFIYTISKENTDSLQKHPKKTTSTFSILAIHSIKKSTGISQHLPFKVNFKGTTCTFGYTTKPCPKH